MAKAWAGRGRMENNREYDRWYSTTPPWVLATCAGVGAGLVLIVFQTVCQGVNRGCEGREVRSLVSDDYAAAAAVQVRSRRHNPGVISRLKRLKSYTITMTRTRRYPRTDDSRSSVTAPCCCYP